MEELRVNSFSSFSHRWKYDVFLNFRGQDTRHNFTGNLYKTLRKKGIYAFMDDREPIRGREISAALFQAIEQSRISIIIFSENYAFSPWCLDELVKIMECYKIKGQLVWPVFYNVDPSTVRYQTKGFGRAMAKHVNKFKTDSQKVQKWRFVLNEAANLSGWHFTNGPLFVTDHPVGLDSRLSDLNPQLGMGLDDVRMIGICGFGGTGKSTLAQALYNLIADQFDGASFVADVRENSSKEGLVCLQEKFLAEILGEENIQLGNVNKGISIISRRLCSKKVLLILDDVQKPEHLEKLAGSLDWFGPGSRIVVTTREKNLLIQHRAKFYEIEKLNYNEALELFSWHAFRRKIPEKGFEYVAKRALCYANGLPLALKIMGSNLYGKGLGEWSCTLDKYERVPPRDIQNILQISYNNLEENEKEIFLDLACFFKGEKLECVKKILEASGFHPESGIGPLVEKSLINIEYNRVKMHDLIQHMGREIIRQSSRLNPGKRSRLWFHEDIIEVLTNNTGTDKIQGIMLELHEEKEVHWSGDAFRKMPNLRIIVVRNALFSCGPTYLPNSLRVLEWSMYPSPSLPEDFHPRKLVVMSLPGSHLTLEMPFKKFKYLTFMDFTGCEFLNKIPDMSAVPNLTILKLDFCQNLVEIHDSVGYLCNLVILSARSLVKLNSFPDVIKLMSLELLDLGGFSSSQTFPNVLEKLENIRTVDLRGTAIKELPSSMGDLHRLKHLGLDYCTSLWNIPSSIKRLTNLTSISMECCPQVISSLTSNLDFQNCQYILVNKLNFRQCGLSDDALPLIIHCFPNVEYLNISKNKFVTISECINKLYNLQRLHLDDCKLLKKIKGCPCNLVLLSTTNCDRLTSHSVNMLGVAHQQPSEKNLEVILPATKIPECFNYHFGQGNMSFWVRKSFPDIPLCLVSEMEDEEKIEEDYYATFKIWIHINSLSFLKFSVNRDCGKTHNHVRLIHLHSYISQCSSPGLESFKNIDTFLQSEWNHVDIFWKVDFFQPTEGFDLGITGPGIVHIYGNQSKMEDILLRNPGFQGIDTMFSTTEEGMDKTVNSEGDYSYSQTTNDDESVDGGHTMSYKDEEEDSSIGLLLQWSQNDPLTLESQNIWIEDNDFFSHGLVNCILDEKCFTRGQAANENDTSMTWDPMKMEYHMTCQREQLVSIVQRGIRDEDNGSRWQFLLCALISSVVSLCSSLKSL